MTSRWLMPSHRTRHTSSTIVMASKSNAERAKNYRDRKRGGPPGKRGPRRFTIPELIASGTWASWSQPRRAERLYEDGYRQEVRNGVRIWKQSLDPA
jgi:hypothetical protein